MTSTIIEDMAALLVKVGSCPLPPDLADEVREMLERMKEEGFYPEPLTNFDWLRGVGRSDAIAFLARLCLHQEADRCTDSCPYRHDGDGCNAYTAGMDALAHWLFEEKKEVSDANKQQD